MKTKEPQTIVDEFIRHHGDTPENLPAFWSTWEKAWELAVKREKKNLEIRTQELIAIRDILKVAKKVAKDQGDV